MYYYLPPSPNYPLEGNTKQVIRRTACQIPSMWRLSPTTLSQRHMDLHVWSYPLKSVLGFKNTRGGSNVALSQYFWLFQQLQSWQYDDDDEEQFTIYRFPFHGDILIQLTRLSSWCMPRAAAAANQSPWRFTYAHTGYVPLEYVPWHSIKKLDTEHMIATLQWVSKIFH